MVRSALATTGKADIKAHTNHGPQREKRALAVTAGLDAGGAHLKIAVAEDGIITDVRQIACPLWQGLDKLEAAIAEARPLLERASRVALTMTGELSDLFPNRPTGVETLVRRFVKERGQNLKIWLGMRGLGTPGEALSHPADAGSTNFLATAAYVARQHPDALLIDFGTTTADIIPIRGGAPVPQGLTDADRQATGELVYTGLTRTAVMAVASTVPFRGRLVSLQREYLATMADVRRILGEDLTAIDLHGTADGKGKSIDESVIRLARMVGRDAMEAPMTEWRHLALTLREAQLRTIHDGALLVLSAANLSDTVPVVAAGVGAGEVTEIARRLMRRTISFHEIAPSRKGAQFWTTACAPAVSLALMV